MKLSDRNRMYFLFTGVQAFAVFMLIIGFSVKAVSRDPNECDEKVGLLIVQIWCTIEITVKLCVFIIYIYVDRFANHPESFGKCLSCFMSAVILWFISVIMVIAGSTLVKKMAFWLSIEALSFLNEGLFHWYHLKTYGQA